MLVSNSNITIEQVARAALNFDYLHLRALSQEFLHQNPRLSEVDKPQTNDLRLLAAAASLLELFALRANQPSPSWTEEIGPLPEKEKLYLVKNATIQRNTFTRTLCDTESPEPLRKRGFFATPNFLEFL